MILNVPDLAGHEQLAANRERLTREMRARLNGFEPRYELASAGPRAALERGVISETAEVTEWLIVRGMYSALLDERQSYAD